MKPNTVMPEPSGHDWESLLRALREEAADRPARREELARRLADVIPEEELRAVVAELCAEEAKRRRGRYETHLVLARTASERGSLDAARREAEAACALDVIRWEGHRLLGELLERSGDAESALPRYVLAMHLGWEGEESKRAIERVCEALELTPRRR